MKGVKRAIRGPRPPTALPKYLTQDELGRFLRVIHSVRDKALFDVIYHYGFRVDEIPLLTLADVDLRTYRLRVRRLKNGLGGEKPLWRSTAKLLRSYLRIRRGESPYFFLGRKGPLRKRQIQHLFGQYASTAGIVGRSVHCLRHSIAVHLLDEGYGIEYVADHLGHKNITNTRIYAQISQPRREQIFRDLEGAKRIVWSK